MSRCALAFGMVILSAGCGAPTLETGYKPVPLGATPTERRSYYASPFTPEARAAQVARERELEQRRPIPGQ